MENAKTKAAIDALNLIMEFELAGVVKYTHYSLMVFGYNRIPIVSWLKGNADESLLHAHRAGELVTLLGGHPALKIGSLLDTAKHDIGDILRALGLSALIFALGGSLTLFLPETAALPAVILVITTLGVGASFKNTD